MNFVTNWIQNVLITKYLGAAIKKGLTILAAYLVMKGIATGSEAQAVESSLSQIVPGIISFLLSMWASSTTRKALIATEPGTLK